MRIEWIIERAKHLGLDAEYDLQHKLYRFRHDEFTGWVSEEVREAGARWMDATDAEDFLEHLERERDVEVE
jgi:hypothetical protein